MTVRLSLVPAEDTIYGWIETIFARGIRRPGYDADRWIEDYCLDRFQKLGLENIRREPVTLPSWEPVEASLVARSADGEMCIPCLALPHSATTNGLEAPLALWHDEGAGDVRGQVVLADIPLMRMPPDLPAALKPRAAHETGRETDWRIFDPRHTFKGATQVMSFNRRFMAVMDAPRAAGAVGFIGVLSDYPGGSHQYYVPYDAVARDIPGVWIGRAEGERLRRLAEHGAVRVRLVSRALRHEISCDNIIGELSGADDDMVIIGSHHDGPWSSAVEDASGISLVLAQAAYWSHLAPAQRPHRLLFLLNAGHMAGGAGVHAFVERHRAALDRVVLEVHLEHTANEVVERDGELVITDLPEPRWWFTTRHAELERNVRDAIVAEGLERSLILPPDVFGPMPTTDGGPFHPAGVPLVNFLTAPFYLFDAIDTLDKIHRPSLVPVTRAAIRLVQSTAGVTAAAMRAGVRAA